MVCQIFVGFNLCTILEMVIAASDELCYEALELVESLALDSVKYKLLYFEKIKCFAISNLMKFRLTKLTGYIFKHLLNNILDF